MDRKTFTIILAVALIASFFLKFIGGVTGLDIVKADYVGWEKYVLLLIPVCGLLLLLGAMGGNYPLGRSTLCWLPLLAIIFWVIITPLLHNIPLKYLFDNFKNYAIGFWIALVASLVLVFYNPRR